MRSRRGAKSSLVRRGAASSRSAPTSSGSARCAALSVGLTRRRGCIPRSARRGTGHESARCLRLEGRGMVTRTEEELEVIETTVQKTYRWIRELDEELDGVGRRESYQVLRGF